MEEFLIDVARSAGNGPGAFVWPLILAGAALILVNILSQRIIQRLSDTAKRREEVTHHLQPVLDAAADLVSRLSDILIAHQQTYLRIFQAYDPQSAVSRLGALRPVDMNRHESTGFRLVYLLALAEDFRRKTAGTRTFPLLERADFYLQHKIAVALRGNLYGHQLLSTEMQQEMAAAALRSPKVKQALDFTTGDLCALMSSGAYDPQLFKAALDVLCVDTAALGADKEIDRNSEAWRHILSLAQLGVYLIDFFHDLGNNCQWEQQRVFFVKLVCEWNQASARYRYLYELGDLDTGNYLDSYPGELAPRGVVYSLTGLLAEILHLRRAVGRVTKFMSLNRRGLRFRRRHHTKTIHSWGIRIRGDGRTWELDIRKDRRTVYDDLKAYLRARSF
jgi:hypothetical protein